MSEANNRQVGGAHYKGGFQHWDMVIAGHVPYLEGCATKYLVRHKRKNGKEDLEKALHYVAKIRENWIILGVVRVDRSTVDRLLHQYPELGPYTREAVRKILNWEQPADLYFVEDLIRQIISTEYPDA